MSLSKSALFGSASLMVFQASRRATTAHDSSKAKGDRLLIPSHEKLIVHTSTRTEQNLTCNLDNPSEALSVPHMTLVLRILPNMLGYS